MVQLMQKAASVVPVANLWTNPDCGLKTRGWPETEAALGNMVQSQNCCAKRWLKPLKAA